MNKTQHSKKGVAFLVFLAIPLFLSVDLYNISLSLDRFMNTWKVASTVIILFLLVNSLIGRKKISTNILPMFVLVVVLLISTVINDGSLGRFFTVWGGFLAVCLLVEANIRERPLQLLLALKISLGLILFINFSTVLMAPEGLWRTATEGYWLLGHRNNFGAPIIATIVVSVAYDLLNKGRMTFSTLLILVASFASVMLTWSASSVVATALVIIASLMVVFGRGIGFIKPIVLLVVYIVIDIGIVFFHIQDRWSDFIENVLNRSTDLTGRTRIWGLVMDRIEESPIWGTGVQLAENNGLTQYNANFVHAHNGELDIIFQGGFVAFIPFVVMILMATIRADRFYSSRAVQILFIGLILIMFRAITGLFFSSYACLLLYLVLNSSTIWKHEPNGIGRNSALKLK
ncbi:O-antigen ligase family protein [Glutamicibacter sp.]|uniref:O-antigen ligase family protein n=1 Tax=Glutamicibacter sp. TaxID=1931995 RepID=UPI0028BEF917|nr:O-antigen ligase family protein [Glutamicibacter sp.]